MAKKKKFRFYIGTETERFSSVYSITVHRGNVYLISKSLGGIAKCSFHEGGVCHFGFTNEYWKKNFIGMRYSPSRWRRPTNISLNRFAPIAFVRFQNNLLKARHSIASGNLNCVRAPQRAQMVEIILIIASPEISGTERAFQNQNVLWEQNTKENEKLLVLSQRGPERHRTDDIVSKLNPHGPRYEWTGISEMAPGERMEDLNATLATKPKDGEPIILTEISGLKFTKY
ncbi:hypothetical protein [Ruegeria sp. HKCCA4812]|uniref:hypothetical protein n=1 Tax=Ruegeria sp. HKCCA4812 TaxID=2682993 RepID=UPI0014891101|nr:hypothetical protein [Ruegeria sp. HKCCA4812]